MGIGMGETYDELSRCAPTSGKMNISYNETRIYQRTKSSRFGYGLLEGLLNVHKYRDDA